MTQVNCCLKWLLVTFNIKYAMVGVIIIILGLTSQFSYIDAVVTLNVHAFKQTHFYIVGSIVMAIAILGAVAVCSESKPCMILFLVCVIFGSIVMLLLGGFVAVFRSQFERSQERFYRHCVPLDKELFFSSDVERIQTEMHCCGLFSYKDWEGNIPDSCLCNTTEKTEGKCVTVDYKGVLQQKKSVHNETCFPKIRSITEHLFNSIMVAVVALVCLGLLGMVLSSIMIHQLRRPNKSVAVLMTVPQFTKPPKYQELHNVLPPKYY